MTTVQTNCAWWPLIWACPMLQFRICPTACVIWINQDLAAKVAHIKGVWGKPFVSHYKATTRRSGRFPKMLQGWFTHHVFIRATFLADDSFTGDGGAGPPEVEYSCRAAATTWNSACMWYQDSNPNVLVHLALLATSLICSAQSEYLCSASCWESVIIWRCHVCYLRFSLLPGNSWNG